MIKFAKLNYRIACVTLKIKIFLQDQVTKKRVEAVITLFHYKRLDCSFKLKVNTGLRAIIQMGYESFTIANEKHNETFKFETPSIACLFTYALIPRQVNDFSDYFCC